MSKTKTAPTRNAARTRQRILQAAIGEFCEKGLLATRVDQIAARAKSNVRMLYHYFGNKEGLYVAALNHVYKKIGEREQALNLQQFTPVEGIERLIDFTFSYMAEHKEFVTLIGNENMVRARFLKRSKIAPQLNQPLIDQITNLLKRGEAEGVFRTGVDPVHLYVSIAAQSYFHISNRYTLTTLFGRNVSDPEWLAAHLQLIRGMVLSYLTNSSSAVGRRRRTAAPDLATVENASS